MVLVESKMGKTCLCLPDQQDEQWKSDKLSLEMLKQAFGSDFILGGCKPPPSGIPDQFK